MTSLADLFVDAVERGEVAAARELLAPDVAVWHNSDGKLVGREACAAALASLVRLSTRRAYRDRRVTELPTGFLFQFTLVAEAPAGRLDLPGCMICTVRDGRISRIEEYIDPTPFRAWLGAVAATKPI